MLFREMAGIDAFPLCLGTQDPGEIITIVKNIATGFGGINLEDIAAPRCFEIEDSLQGIGIPVMHDDQHGAGVITRAALINAAKVVGKEFGDLRVAIIGAGAAGTGIARLLMCQGLSGTACTPVRDVVLCDSRGILHEGRSDMNPYKAALAALTNVEKRTGGIAEAIVGMDALIGVSVAGILKPSLIATMARDPIVFAMANPVPEILPDAARAGGAAIVGTGRSDFPNQINNALAFPGIFRGALDARARTITPQMKQTTLFLIRWTGKSRAGWHPQWQGQRPEHDNPEFSLPVLTVRAGYSAFSSSPYFFGTIFPPRNAPWPSPIRGTRSTPVARFNRTERKFIRGCFQTPPGKFYGRNWKNTGTTLRI
jgi:malate dehydrogenase (oxaloacetate-decarboxylating)